MSTPFRYTFRVPFYDVDPLRIVWHGNYVKYLEEARCAFLEHLGTSYNDLEQIGIILPVIGLEMKYIQPCKFGEQLAIDIRIKSAENFLELDYTIRDLLTEKVRTKATTRQAAIARDSGELFFELPPELLRRLHV